MAFRQDNIVRTHPPLNCMPPPLSMKVYWDEQINKWRYADECMATYPARRPIYPTNTITFQICKQKQPEEFPRECDATHHNIGFLGVCRLLPLASWHSLVFCVLEQFWSHLCSRLALPFPRQINGFIVYQKCTWQKSMWPPQGQLRELPVAS